MTTIHLSQAVLCGDCECISDTTTHRCPVCDSQAVESLAAHIEPLPHIDQRYTAAKEHDELPQQLHELVG